MAKRETPLENCDLARRRGEGFAMLNGWLDRRELERRQQQHLAEVLLETGGEAPNATFGVRDGDERTARGVPILGFKGGLGGAILGTRPDAVVERKLDRLLGSRAA